MNENNGTGAGYHWSHVHVRNKIQPHFLDFHHYPPSFKSYETLLTIDLDRPGTAPAAAGSDKGRLTLAGLAEILFFAYGVISGRQNGPVRFYQRTVPSAGGLYPCNLYLGLEAGSRAGRCQEETDTMPETGLYYYDPVHSRLVQLRSPGPSESGQADHPGRALFFITASFYNSTWKYRGRAYRYMLLDGGHLVQNLEVILRARGVDVRVSYEFPGDEAARFLGMDTGREAVLACVRVGWNKSVPEILGHLTAATRPGAIHLASDPAHERYVEGFAELAAVHGRCLTGSTEALDIPVTGQQPVEARDLDLEKLPCPEPGGLNRLIYRRRSRRNFTPVRLERQIYLTLFSWLDGFGETSLYRFLRLGMICQNLDGLVDGFYLFDRTPDRLSLMTPGPFASGLARACLDQAWIGRASISFLCLTCPDELEADPGSAGYRHMMLDAGRLGHQIYLGAEALGLGCCGVGAIYDHEAQSLLGLSGNAALVYALCVGPVR